MNQNIHKEFEDHSWERMRALLDRDMPENGLLIPPVSDTPLVSKGGKKQLWLWAFLIVAMGSLAWYCFSTNKAIENKPIVETPVSNEKKGVNTVRSEGIPMERDSYGEGGYFANSPSLLSKNRALDEKNTLIRLENQEVIYHISSLSTVSKAHDVVIPRNEESEYKISNNGILHSDSSFLGMTKSLILETVAQLENKDIVMDNKDTANASKPPLNSAYLEFLPLLQAYIIETPDTSFKINTAQPIVKTIPKNKAHRITWGITAGAHTEGGKKMDGFQAGFILSKTMSPKWRLQTGLNFRRSTAQGDSLTFVQLNEKAANVSSTATNFNLSQGKVLTLKNLNYLEMPVTVHYNLPKKFSVFGGIKAAYLLSNSVTIRDTSTFYIVSNANADKRSNFVQNNSVQALGLKRWDGALVGGVSYNVSSKMAVSLRYDLGFKNILTKQNWKAYNRYVGLNVAYEFK